MRLGAVYPQTELRGDPEAVRRIGRATEELGYDHLVVYDHVVGADHEGRDPKLWGPYTDRHPFHDPFVMLGHLAALTERIELVTGVLILPQRQTVLVAKQATDVDLLSGGRLRLGVGVGWNYVEYEALGEDFSTRGARVDEQIGFLRRLWSEDLLDWQGRFDRITRGNVLPRPGRPIPIWIGGFGEAAFRRGATLGDGFLFAGSPDRVLPAVERVKELVRQAGRAVEDFPMDWCMTQGRTVDDAADSVKRFEAAGGTHASVVTMGQGLDSIDGHVDFLAAVKDRIG